MNRMDMKSSYSGKRFVELEENDETFFVNCWFYITINITCAIGVFLVLKWLFRFCFNLKVSIFLRPFSFWLYLGPILVEGNLQFFFFLMFSQSFLGFSLNSVDKYLTTTSFVLFFLFFWYAFSSYFFYFNLYKRLAKYFFDNWRCRLSGTFMIFFTNSLRNFMMAAVHSLARNHYQLQLTLLFGI